MENIWLYFFSAVMQTAASMASLFSIFALFKIESLNNKIKSIRSQLIKVFISVKNKEKDSGTQEIQKEFCTKYNIGDAEYLYEEFSDNNIIKIFNDLWNNKFDLKAEFQFGNIIVSDNNANSMKKLISNKKGVVDSLQLTLILFALLIILSAIFLSFPDDVRSSEIIYEMILAVSVIIGYCVYSIYFIASGNID